jgi:hypothetical protein
MNLRRPIPRSPPRLTDSQPTEKADREGHTPEARISKDGRLQLIVVRTAFGFGRPCPRRAASRRHREGQRRDRGGGRARCVVFGVAGDVVSTLAEQRGLVHGMVVATAITVILVFLALLWFYRSLLAVLALLFALATGPGDLRLRPAHHRTSQPRQRVPVVHRDRQRHQLRHYSAGTLFRGTSRGTCRMWTGLSARSVATVPGTLAATATASVAYGSLAITQFRGFRDFGIIGGVGMAFCWVATYALLPALLFALERRGWLRPGPPEPRSAAGSRVLLPHRPKWVVASAVSLLVLVSHRGRALSSGRSNRGEHAQSALVQPRAGAGIGLDGQVRQSLRAWHLGRLRHRGSHAGRTRPPWPSDLRQADVGKDERARLFSNIVTLDDVLPKDQEAKLQVLADIRRLMDGKALRALPDEGSSPPP